tara:strand:- start:132 stop:392 length:261 start_codon:yes stop_codon:yes gene_type:complete
MLLFSNKNNISAPKKIKIIDDKNEIFVVRCSVFQFLFVEMFVIRSLSVGKPTAPKKINIVKHHFRLSELKKSVDKINPALLNALIE